MEMKRCGYCKTLQFVAKLKRGEIFGTLICKDRKACDARKVAMQDSGR